MRRRFSDDVDLVERKLFGILALLSDDDWLDAPKSGDLPVDVQHLRLEKSRAVKSGDWPWISWVAQCLESNSPQDESVRKADIKQENQKLIVNSLIPFHFPVSGSSTTLSSALPYCAGAFGFNI